MAMGGGGRWVCGRCVVLCVVFRVVVHVGLCCVARDENMCHVLHTCPRWFLNRDNCVEVQGEPQ